MGDPRAFLQHGRAKSQKRPVSERVHDFAEIETPHAGEKLATQAARCMDCGVPFCHSSCPLGNLIPEWNHLVYRGNMEEAAARLEATNNFPEFTARLCPAPCEGSCVLAIHDEAVTIKGIEHALADHITRAGLVPMRPATARTRRRVAVIGSGPAGLACAQELVRDGHDVVVFEKADRPGGLLRYGIPDFKMDKALLDQRVAQIRAEGVRFECGVEAGKDIPPFELESSFDAIALAIGAERPRRLNVLGEHLPGVHFAMDYLTQQNRVIAGDPVPSQISAEGRDVVILGGGDTGADCLGTATRQHARSILQLEIAERPPNERGIENPWPEWPVVFRTSSAHEEAGERGYAAITTEIVAGADRRVSHLIVADARRNAQGTFEPVAGTEREIPAGLVLVAAGFVGPSPTAMVSAWSLATDGAGRIRADARGRTQRSNVFACGDARRGASLVVWAIAEGRAAAASIGRALSDRPRMSLPMV